MDFKSSDAALWREALGSYEAVIKTLVKPDIISLDDFYRNELPNLLHQRDPNPYITTDELSRLMQWKLARGKWRPRLLSFVSSLDDVVVRDASAKAFASLPDVSKAITELAVLKGVGPATASAVLAAYAPDVAPFMSDEVPHELHDAFISAVDRGNIRTMPNRSMPAAPHPTPGALLMGDAFNMRHPLTGGGMTVALSDIVVLCNLLRPLHDLNDASALCKYLESFYTLRKPVAATINTLAGALYKVFSSSPDQARKEMRQACFDYLSLGGVFSNGPVSLLSGLNPRPLSLVCHFFAVAIYGVGRLLLPFPSPKRMWIGARLISAASGIIFPIIKAEGVRQMFFPATVPAYYRAPSAH
ncbi:UNVERIFIED_CONTAM: Squalene monooxygenase SE1 [Sesamum radiatum]|uniref:Squalene monooxygenase n=1 Tax=Sesamum radiatum TaxID=300843 RepID=A0AAW2SI50_SESRA